MTDPFSSPASGNFKAAEHNGKLLLITPNDYLTEVQTVNGPKDAVDAQVVVIDEKTPADSEVIDNGRLFGGRLIAATKPFVKKGMVLGRLGQGEAKKGQNAPWILDDPTDADRDVARAYLQSIAPSI